VKLLILENLDLRARLRLERIEKYGPAAEALSDAQLDLLELESGVNAAEATPGATPSRGETLVGEDQNFGSGSQKNGTATQPLSRRLRLSTQTLEAAHLLSAIRPVGALDQSGRKRNPPHSAWPQELAHLGCQGAGPRIAAIISVIETCRRFQIRPRDYLAAILPGLADFPVKRVAEPDACRLGSSILINRLRLPRTHHNKPDSADFAQRF